MRSSRRQASRKCLRPSALRPSREQAIARRYSLVAVAGSASRMRSASLREQCDGRIAIPVVMKDVERLCVFAFFEQLPAPQVGRIQFGRVDRVFDHTHAAQMAAEFYGPHWPPRRGFSASRESTHSRSLCRCRRPARHKCGDGCRCGNRLRRRAAPESARRNLRRTSVGRRAVGPDLRRNALRADRIPVGGGFDGPVVRQRRLGTHGDRARQGRRGVCPDAEKLCGGTVVYGCEAHQKYLVVGRDSSRSYSGCTSGVSRRNFNSSLWFR